MGDFAIAISNSIPGPIPDPILAWWNRLGTDPIRFHEAISDREIGSGISRNADKAILQMINY